MAKEPMDGPHELRLENRARLSVNGVLRGGELR